MLVQLCCLGRWTLEIWQTSVSWKAASGDQLLPIPYVRRPRSEVRSHWARYELSHVVIGGARLGGR